MLGDVQASALLEASLPNSLGPEVTQYLPVSMAFPGKYADIREWLSDRLDEAHVLVIRTKRDGAFAGMLLLHDAAETDERHYYVGYFFDPQCWGKGYATEALNALITAIDRTTSVRLFAGVDIENQSSARVLEKVGFSRDTTHSTASRSFYELLIA